MKQTLTLQYVLLLQCFLSVFGLDDYIPWSPDGVKNLWCPLSSGCTNKTAVETSYCCACHAVPEWELPDSGGLLIPLYVELINVRGTKGKLVSSSIKSTNKKHYFHHIFGELQKFPINACDYRIVSINVTGNLFTEIGNLSCYTELDTLIMKNNRITTISNQTFLGMNKLRIADFSYNLITHIDYDVFGGIHILKFNLDGNRFRSLDISNVFFPNKTVCGVSYAYNDGFIKMTNEGKLKLGHDDTFICSDSDFSYTSMSKHPLILIAPLDPKTIYKHAPCGEGRHYGAAFNCDCHIAEFFGLKIEDFFRVYSKQVDELYCQSPHSLANISIGTVYANKTLRDLMICDVVEGCPMNGGCKCKCTSQPSNNALIVDCSNQTCTGFPEIVPYTQYRESEKYLDILPIEEKHKIILNMSYNNISYANTNNYYFEKVKTLDLAENSIKALGNNILNLGIVTQVVLTSHTLTQLPKTIQLFNPNIFIFGKNGIPCTCDNRWIGEWRLYKNASRQFPYALACSNYDNMLIEDLVDQLAECESNENSLSKWWILILILICLILFIFALYYCFRHEFSILRTKLFDRQKINRNGWITDIYTSFDDENDEVRYYVLLMLEKFLRKMKMTTYIPCRDAWPGITEEENILQNMPRCKYVLIIQSTGMYNLNKNRAFTKCMEYKLAWNFFTRRKIEKILILTFDTDKPEKFQFSVSRALFNFGMGFAIHNRKQSLHEKILEVFSEPIIVNSKYQLQRTKQIKTGLWDRYIKKK